MKYCPTCETRYDEEILRFCMKDGTPLVDEDEPKFVEMPSESFESPIDEDDPGEVTVIRKNIPVPPPPPSFDEEESFTEREASKPRIVVPMASEPAPRMQPAVQYQQPSKPNTFKVVVLTIIGTVSLLALGALGLWAFMRGTAETSNVNANANNANVNTNVNTNLGVDFNFNTNANFNTNSRTNSNVNVNSNTNTKTPTPTPTATPSPRPTDSPDATPSPTPTATRTPIPTPSPTTIIIRPGGSPTPRTTPRPATSLTPNRPGNN